MIGLYPGSFDPISTGHLDIIKRASKLCSKLYVLVAINPNKDYVFTLQERMDLVIKACKDINNVEVKCSDGITVKVAKELNVDVLIRGVRNQSDIEYETNYSNLNKQIDSSIQTKILKANKKYIDISSSLIKENFIKNKDIDYMLPSNIANEVKDKLKERLTK